MKKLLSLLLALALIGTAAAGCGKEPETIETQPPATSAAEWVLEAEPEEKQYDGVELTCLSSWAEDAPESAVLTQAAELFEATTGAVVQIRWLPEYYEDGDILQMPGSVLADNYKDRVLDLTDMAQAAGYESRSIECLRDQVVSRCGTLSAIAQTPYVSGFYYNREVFEDCGITQLPRTYEEFLDVCAVLVEKGYSPLTLDSEAADELLMMHLTQYLGTDAAARLAAEGGWTESEQVLQATVEIRDFVKAGFLAYATPAAYPAGQNRMGLSNCAFVYGTNDLCAQVEEDTMTELSWGMFPYPGVGGAEPVISVDADVLAVSADSENPQAAFDFIMLLVTGEFDQLRADITNGIPADPNNESPVAGAVEAMEITQVMETAEADFDEQQMTVILKLWQGKYKDDDAFVKAMDKLYVK